MFFFGMAAIATSLGSLRKKPSGEDAKALFGVGIYGLMALAFLFFSKIGACEQKGRFIVLIVITVILSMLSFPIYTKVGQRLLQVRRKHEEI